MRGQWILEITCIADERPSRPIGLLEIARGPAKAPQTTDQPRIAKAIAKLGRIRGRNLHEPTFHVSAERRRKAIARNTDEDAVLPVVRWNDAGGDALFEEPVDAVILHVLKVAEDATGCAGSFDIGCGVGQLGDG